MSPLARMFAAPPRPVETLADGWLDDLREMEELAVVVLAKGLDEADGFTLYMLPAPPRPVCIYAFGAAVG